MSLETSIFKNIKQLLQIDGGTEDFDQDIYMHINSAISELTDIGVGPPAGFIVNSESVTWDQLVEDDLRYESVKTFIFLKVRLYFDPPQSQFGMQAMERQIDQLVWRLSARRELKNYVEPV